MNQGDLLLRAILECPADDTARLVYADWLEERAGTRACSRCSWVGSLDCPECHGTPTLSDGRAERAEFIRVQCEMAKPIQVALRDLLSETYPGEALALAAERNRERLDALRRREWELPQRRPADGAGWEGPLLASLQARDLRWMYVFRRGFVEAVTCTAASDWLAHGPAVVASQPIVEVRLRDRHPCRVPEGRRWCLARAGWGDYAEERHHLPAAIYDRLPGRRPDVPDLAPLTFWHEEADALAALSVACVAFAREAVGLPPLPAGVPASQPGLPGLR